MADYDLDLAAAFLAAYPVAPDAVGSEVRGIVASAAPIIAKQERERIIVALRAKFGPTNRAADWLSRGGDLDA